MKRFIALLERAGPDTIGVLIAVAALGVLAVMERVTAWCPPL